MKSLENRTLDSKREMDIIAALDEMKSMKVLALAIVFCLSGSHLTVVQMETLRLQYPLLLVL